MTGGRVSAMVPSKSEINVVRWHWLIFATAKTDHQNDVSTKLLRVLDKIKTQYILQTFKLPVESGQSNDQPEPDTLEPQTGEGHSEAP